MRQEEAKQQETPPHFKRSSVLHPLAEQIKMVMEEKPYTLPHPIWSVRLYYHFVCRFVSYSPCNSYNTGRRDVLDLLTEPEGA